MKHVLERSTTGRISGQFTVLRNNSTQYLMVSGKGDPRSCALLLSRNPYVGVTESGEGRFFVWQCLFQAFILGGQKGKKEVLCGFSKRNKRSRICQTRRDVSGARFGDFSHGDGDNCRVVREIYSSHHEVGPKSSFSRRCFSHCRNRARALAPAQAESGRASCHVYYGIDWRDYAHVFYREIDRQFYCAVLFGNARESVGNLLRTLFARVVYPARGRTLAVVF